MAQLRQDYSQFEERHTIIVVLGPDSAKEFHRYFTKHDIPFIGLPDPRHSVLRLYGQEINIFKFGRMPAQVLVDKKGIARFVHYGLDMTDIPPTLEMLALIDQTNVSVSPIIE